MKKEKLKVELLGIGSIKNRKLKANLIEALDILSLNVPIVEVRDIDKLMKYDISGIPALVIDGKVVFEKIVPNVEDLRIILSTLLRAKDSHLNFPNILVPTDFSGASRNAFHYALFLAEQEKASVKVVHVRQSQWELGNPYQVDPLIMKGDATHEELLDDFTDITKNQNGYALPAVNITKKMLSGFAVEEIVNLTHTGQTSLVVMGTRQNPGLLEKWFGSISSEVARKAFCPVLLVPGKASFSGFKNIVYASDFTPEEELVFPRLINMAGRYEACVHFVHVQENKLNGYLVDSTGGRKIFRMADTSLKMTVIECEDILNGLNRYASEHKADLMVMTTSHRNFFDELFHKSMTKKMVFNSEIPLLVLHFED